MGNIINETMDQIARLFASRQVILSDSLQEELKAVLLDALTKNFQQGQAMAFQTMLRFNKR